MLQFETIILKHGESGDAAYIETPIDADIEQIFGQKRPKVRATFDGKVIYRGLLTRMKSVQHFLVLRQDIRKQLSKTVGDKVQVLLELDIEPRKVEIPTVLQNLFLQNTDAQAIFNGLSYTCQKEYVEHINEAKKVETQERRAHKTIEALLKK